MYKLISPLPDHVTKRRLGSCWWSHRCLHLHLQSAPSLSPSMVFLSCCNQESLRTIELFRDREAMNRHAKPIDLGFAVGRHYIENDSLQVWLRPSSYSIPASYWTADIRLDIDSIIPKASIQFKLDQFQKLLYLRQCLSLFNDLLGYIDGVLVGLWFQGWQQNHASTPQRFS